MAASKEGVLENCDSVDNIISILSTLVKPPEGGDTVVNINSSLNNNLTKALSVCGEEKLKNWIVQQNVFTEFESEHDSNWKFLCVCLTCLLRLKELTLGTGTLVSINQKTVVKSSLQFINALGIFPHLHPGVGIAMESRSKKYVPDFKSNLTEADQCSRLSSVVRVLLQLLDDKSWDLYGVVLSTVLSELLPALIQLSWAPNASKPQAREFRERLSFLVESTHQATLIRELLICVNPRPGAPVWYVRVASRLLTQRLLAPQGVVSTVRALHDLSHSEENESKRYETTSKLLMGPHGPNPQSYYLQLCPQLLELLKSGNPEYKNVALKTIFLLWTKQPDLCSQQILKSLWQPFNKKLNESEGNLILEKIQEEEYCFCVETMLSLTCLDGIPVDALSEVFPGLCGFYKAIWQRGGTPHLRNTTKELLSQVINHSDREDIWKALINLPQDCLLSLSSNTAVANSMFSHLLLLLYKTKDLQEKLSYCELLMSLAEIPSVQRQSLQKPNPMLIDTIKCVLEDSDTSMSPVALLLLGTMVSECEDFSQYQPLVPALQKLRQSPLLTESIRAIAEEIISSIATFGAVNMDKPTEAKKQEVLKKSEEKKQNKSPLDCLTFEEAMDETKDSEIPTQGHGFLALTKLINKKDKDTLQAQDEIFNSCLAGLQHEDSYVYLAAVGTLSSLTLKSLHTWLPRVTATYCEPDRGVNLRTRLGETLLQVCKGVGEMAAAHRTTLLGAFLSGAKDVSPAVRTSSLSNLGETCKVLGFHVTSHMQEILECAHSIARSDPEMEVRRAAAMLVSLLLRGLGTQAVPVLGASALEVYRGLKQLSLSDDETLSLQAQLALEELSHGIKQGVFASQPLEKKIYVTSPPP